MTSGFKKIIIISSVIFVVLLSLLVGIVFFPKERNKNILNQNNQQEERQSENSDKKTELTDEKRVKTIAETFASIYYSYTWGNFSNIESQYYFMTDEMKNREENRVIEMKKEMENQPRKYFTARAKLTDSNFVYYEEEKAAINIDLSIDNFAGAIAQRDTMVLVDEKGDRYAGDIKDLIMNTTNKNIEINLVKIGNEWKIDEIKEK